MEYWKREILIASSFLLILSFSFYFSSNQKVHSAFQDDVQEFEEVFDTNIDKIQIIVGHINSNKVAICWISKWGRLIKVDQSYTKEKNENYQEQLIFHELGHCKYGLSHRNDWTLTDELEIIPRSIMNENLIPPDTYKGHKEYYVEQMKELIKEEGEEY